MLIKQSLSCLLMIDVQERLLAAMHAPETILRNCEILLRAAERMAVPVLVTEQYPAGLGPTVPRLLAASGGAQRLEKVHFSCFAEPGLRAAIEERSRPQMVLAGMEAHVCVAQTALDLALAGYDVFVVADATISRSAANHTAAMARLRDAGIAIVTAEMVLFEWLGRADSDAFRALMPLIK
ncbi:MAG: hydrolase [Alphaproteobacteria bacterium]